MSAKFLFGPKYDIKKVTLRKVNKNIVSKNLVDSMLNLHQISSNIHKCYFNIVF